jgi:hypothetical protein
MVPEWRASAQKVLGILSQPEFLKELSLRHGVAFIRRSSWWLARV